MILGPYGRSAETVVRDGPGADNLRARIVAERRRLFVGRDAELEELSALFDPDCDRPYRLIWGAGGIGKTQLMHALLARAQARGLPHAYIDARHTPPNPPAAMNAIRRVTSGGGVAGLCASGEPALLVIDTLEAWQALQRWLCTELLGQAPDNLRLVLCGRDHPDDTGHRGATIKARLACLRLGSLPPEAGVRYLERRGVARSQHDALNEFARGYPLALAMAADAALGGADLSARTPLDDTAMIAMLVGHIARDAGDGAHRKALDACAVARELTPVLLRKMLGRDDIDDIQDLYAWLSRLAFMEQGGTGLYPHDLVRDALMRDMRWRAPGRYTAMACAVCMQTAHHIAASRPGWSQAASMAADGVYALRAIPLMNTVFKSEGTGALYLDTRYGPDDGLEALVARHEGQESAQWFVFWRQRMPESIHVVRDVEARVAGVIMLLPMENLSASDRAQDPLTRRLWHWISTDVKPGTDDHIPFVRYWVTVDYALLHSAPKTKILTALAAYNLIAPNLRLSAQVFVDNIVWVAFARALGIRAVPHSKTRLDTYEWRIYFQDWEYRAPADYYAAFAERCLRFVRGISRLGTIEGAPRPPRRAVFRRAVKSALAYFDRPDRLKKNPLLASRLVLSRTGTGADDGDRVIKLQVVIEEGVNAMWRRGGRVADMSGFLRVAYLSTARNQKDAAARIGVGYSSFRRELAEARNALADRLWTWEKQLRG